MSDFFKKLKDAFNEPSDSKTMSEYIEQNPERIAEIGEMASGVMGSVGNVGGKLIKVGMGAPKASGKLIKVGMDKSDDIGKVMTFGAKKSDDLGKVYRTDFNIPPETFGKVIDVSNFEKLKSLVNKGSK